MEAKRVANEKLEIARVAWLRGDHSDHDLLYQAFCETVQALSRAQEDVDNAKKNSRSASELSKRKTWVSMSSSTRRPIWKIR